jgi:hypothetical protein
VEVLMVGRKREIENGTSASSKVRVVPIWKKQIDRRQFAKAVIALTLWQIEQAKRDTSTTAEDSNTSTTADDEEGDDHA